jgi:nucleoside-diphosphate-sugar epimerase
VLIAGCGYVGQAAADLFHAANWEVEGWSKSGQQVDKRYPIIAIDISERDEVNARVENFDAVVHCASTRGGDVDLYRRVYLDGARNLMDRFVGSTLLFTSSTSVYAQATGEWVTEQSAAEPQRETGKILRETEKLILANGGLVARSGGIYGPGRSALLKKFLNGEGIVDLADDRFVNQIHRDDAASAIVHLLSQPVGADRIFNVVDDHPILISECYRWLARTLPTQPLPPTRLTSSIRKRGASNKRVSNGRLRGVGWQPRYPSFAEGMEQSVLPARREGS